ncbi:MAG: ABC transporter permease [Chloroflexi bacterium]|nr:ABC transporter permease [Chloroflexota bacterium]MCL5076006.1 ABC transporter permease [Chloroflexota bacterium]
MVIILSMLAAAILAPLLVPYNPLELHMAERLQSPSAKYLLGTDEFGRDILSRIIYGIRISLGVAVSAVVIAVSVGVPTGLISGYFGGMVDAVIMRLWDFLLAFPIILLGLTIMAILGPSSSNVALAVAIVNIPIFSRVSRASTLAERGKLYVQAAQVIGASSNHIMFKHILPNATPPLLVQVTVSTAQAILLEAAFSFLGLGAQPPEPSLGTMLQYARIHLNANPWYGIFPGVAITTLILGLSFLADSLRDALDPTLLRRAK